MNEWIHVTAALPKYGDRYLTRLNNGQMHILTWVSSYWADGYTTVTNVTHWMPLPEPPENDDE